MSLKFALGMVIVIFAVIYLFSHPEFLKRGNMRGESYDLEQIK